MPDAGAARAMADENGTADSSLASIGETSGMADAAHPVSFRTFVDRPVSDLEAFEWNASMDLLACLTAAPDSTLTIYRVIPGEELSPKLLSEKVASVGTALAWSPCGRKVAVGDRSGGVAVYDGESGVVLHTRRLHACPVVTLSWTAADVAGGGEPPWSRMLAPLLTVPSASSNMYAEMPDADVEPDCGESFSLLVSGDESGLVVVSAGGTFPLQATRLFHEDGGLEVGTRAVDPVSCARHVSSVVLSPDLRQLAVVLGHPKRTAPSGPLSPVSPTFASPPAAVQIESADAGEADVFSPQSQGSSRFTSARPTVDLGDNLVLLLDVRKLAVRRKELAQCSSMAERLVAVVGYTRQAVDTLGHVWRGAADGLANKMRGLAEAVETYGDTETTSVHHELLLTCCTGNPSNSVHAFISRQTSPQQLTRLERALTQALEYVNLVACTRLQVAGHHILTILHELHACATWAHKFKSIGLDPEPLQRLVLRTQDFLRLTELLLTECAEARKFVRVLFQVLLRTSQRLSDQPGDLAGSLSREDTDDFVARMQRKESLELAGVNRRIGAARSGTAEPVPAASGPTWASVETPGPTTSGGDSLPASLAGAVRCLSEDVEKIGVQILNTVSGHVSLLASMPLRAEPPWTCLPAELQQAATKDAAADLSGPRALGRSTLQVSWEPLEEGKGARMLLAWSGGHRRAEMHLCRIWLKPAPLAAPSPPQIEYARLHACSAGGVSHILLCQVYNPQQVVTVMLQEKAGAIGGGVATVCLVDVASLDFHKMEGDFSAMSAPSQSLDDLPTTSVHRSVALPESYAWASAMRVMHTRSVCSVYAGCRRRLLTLDMDTEEEDEDDEE